MNKKGISMLVIVAIIVIAVVVGGIAAYYVLTSGEGGEPTPTPTPSGPDVEGATSISFDVGIPDVETDKFTAKNLGTSEVLLRVDQTDAQGVIFIYLMDQGEQTVWADFGTGFTDQSDYFEDTYWNSDLIGKVALDKYIAALDAGWSGSGSYTGDGYVIDNIALNPELPDSVFQPTD